jgi:cold shock CspA family protein
MVRREQGYGFIKPDEDSPDVFVHLREVMKAKLPHLRPDVPIAYLAAWLVSFLHETRDNIPVD